MGRPFKNNFYFLLVFFLLIAFIDIAYSFVIGRWLWGIYLAFCNFLISYILTLLVDAFSSKWIRKGVQVFILIPAILFFIIDVVCISNFHFYFNPDMASIIAGTNFDEAWEFVRMFISAELILVFLCCFSVLIGLFYYSKKKVLRLGNKGIALGLLGVVIGMGFTIIIPTLWKRTIVGKIVTCIEASDVPDLELQNPRFQITKKQNPDNVVLIIGESFSKSHSSLYHYPKETNPYLSMLKDSAFLFVYKNVTSPGLYTIEAMECVMSTYKPEYGDSIPWYKCLTIPEMFNVLGYNTCWISNQSKTGAFDNIITKYAELCQENFFIGNKFSGINKQGLDESVIDILSPLLSRTISLNFYVIHLMGSHGCFDERYPSQFSKFTEDNYLSFLPSQRYNLATYDNSILYNDSVVYQVMNLFADKEAVVFYFSDHALDVYDSSKDYVGHARINDSLSVKAGSAIPFMIYASPQYQEHFPAEMELIKNSVDKPFRTDDLLYTLMDIVGVKFDDNQDMEKYSLFRK